VKKISFAICNMNRANCKLPLLTAAVVIVGGGIVGLSSAWRFHKKGFTDFVLLKMNDQAGGNSRWGENEITADPWAARHGGQSASSSHRATGQ
jgi:monoamine oxidase